MPSAAERSDLNPPAERVSVRAFGLALLAHLLLGAALTWGINWKQADPQVSFSAELWSPTAQEAAPSPSAVEPAPPPPPAVVTPPAPPLPQADIAIEREKKRKQKEADERKALAEKEKADKAAKAEQLAKADKAKKLKEAKEKEAKEAAEAQAKAEAQKLQAKKEQDAKKQAAADAAADAKRRKEVMDRLGTAGATGAPDAKGSALQASGPSASYGGKVRAKVKPNVVFTDDISGNPTAEVEVRTTPDGTIISQRLIKSSGNKAWDDAVVKAIIRTETLPRDVDGRVPTPLIITFRPKD